MQRILLISLLFGLFLTNCKKDDDANPIGEPAGETINVPLGTGSVIGNVLDSDGNPLTGVTVTAGSISAISDADGKFELDGIGNSSLVPVTFAKTGYVSTQKIAHTKDNFSTLVEAALLEIGNVTEINTNGGTAIHGDLEVTFPENAFVNLDGQAFQGNADVRATWFNPTDEQFLNMFPGNFEGEREDGSVTSIESFGFIDVEIWAGSQELQLADGKVATIKVPVPNEIKSRAPQTIPLWHYDMNQAKWIEDGAATLDGDFYVGEVTHFTRWNCDVPQTVSFINGFVTDENGKPLEHARVKAEGRDYTGFTTAYTDENGEYTISVRENSEVDLYASHGGWFSAIRIEQTTTVQQTKQVADIIIIKNEVEKPGWYQTTDFNLDRTFQFIDLIDQQNIIGLVLDKNQDRESMLTFTKSNDGGTTWEDTPLNFAYWQGESFNLNTSLKMINNNGLIRLHVPMITLDNGANWDMLKLSPDLEEGARLVDADMISENEIFAVAYGLDTNNSSSFKNAVLYSNDIGQTWELRATDLDIEIWAFGNKQSFPRLLKMVDDQLGFILNTNKIFKTTDGGLNFNLVSTFNANEFITEIHFFDDNNGVAITESSIYETNDGGDSWNLAQSGASLVGKYETYNQSMWVIGNNKILYSSDMGKSWTEQNYSPNIPVFSISFFNLLEGYAFGDDGFTIKTQTAGIE